ncbi:MAG: phage holin family protein [Eubacteriales bacterium]|jgi:toxin secretion/phage lysis holin|nr:phage holin family protein [Eubacteriales bacterium]
MERLENVFKIFSAGATALVTYIFGGIDLAFGILLTLIAIDYITGVIAAVMDRNLSSEIGYRGILKKTGILIVVCLAHLIGTYLGFEVRSWVVGYYIANEGISILENTGRMGVPYPSKIIDVLSQLKED